MTAKRIALFLLLALSLKADATDGIKMYTDENGLEYWIGVSTDTKPTASTLPPGSIFIETNTKQQYRIDDAGSWTSLAQLVYETALRVGDNENLQKVDINQAGTPKNMTADGAVKAEAGALVGFWLSATTACQVALFDDPDSATAPIVLGETAALTVLGWYPHPATFATGLYFNETGVCDLTFVYH